MDVHSDLTLALIDTVLALPAPGLAAVPIVTVVVLAVMRQRRRHAA